MPDNRQKSNESALWLEKVSRIPGVDTGTGIDNCGSEEEFMSAMKIFYDTIEGKAEEIEDYYEAENWEYYTIKVHALKSAARIIGALDISDLSRELEMAGKEGNIGFIRSGNGRLLSLFRGLKDRLDELYMAPDDAVSRTISSEVIAQAYGELHSAAETMDYDTMENIMDNLEKYDFPKEERERYEALKVAWMEMDFPQIISLLDGE